MKAFLIILALTLCALSSYSQTFVLKYDVERKPLKDTIVLQITMKNLKIGSTVLPITSRTVEKDEKTGNYGIGASAGTITNSTVVVIGQSDLHNDLYLVIINKSDLDDMKTKSLIAPEFFLAYEVE